VLRFLALLKSAIYLLAPFDRYLLIGNSRVRSIRLRNNILRIFGIILKKNLVMKIISMDVMSTGVIAYYVLVASRDGSFLFTPIVSDVQKGAYADPVPQAVILTGL
jgi:hypothetical protein